MEKFFEHTFAICAYRKSEFLEECIKSILDQKIKSNIIIVTSTPNEYIKNMADKYNIKLYINEDEKGIGQDWNYGVLKSATKYVTIAHQDDIYDKYYLEKIVRQIEKYGEFVIAFTKYKELKNTEIQKVNFNLKIKEILLFPLKFFRNSKIAKMCTMSFGLAICCPSVTLNTDIVGKKPYKLDMKCNLDWDTWLECTKYKGAYSYIDKYLMYHRIHQDSETSILIEKNIRQVEDYKMLNKIWPKPIARFIMFFYKFAIRSNKI